MSSPAVLTAALTGPIATKADNPALPTSPEEIAAAAPAHVGAGAAVVHVHVRDEQGRPTADLDMARRTDGLIEQACPALIQLSTGVGLTVPFEARERLVEARPRDGDAQRLLDDLRRRGVPEPTRWRAPSGAPDGGARDQAGARGIRHRSSRGRAELHSEGLLAEPLQFSFVLGVRGGAAATPENLLAMVGRLPDGRDLAGDRDRPGQPRDDRDRPCARRQRPHRHGGHVDAAPRRSRALQPELVERLVAVARSLEREPAGVELARQMLGLPA